MKLASYSVIMLRKPVQPRRFRPSLIILVIFLFISVSLYLLPVSLPASVIWGKPVVSICSKLPVESDILLVLRTGATEALEKLPIQLETTLKCVSDYVIYSDFEEDIQGHHIYDVLDQVNDTLKDTVPEFKLYNQLHASGREGLEYQTMFGSGQTGAVDNPGWKLDKWKFLPMVDRALQYKPDAKWFVFMELDTYMVWQTMIEYLSKFDADQPHYIGKSMFIGDVLFAYGGAGFALSRPALKQVTEHWRDHEEEYDQYTEAQWAGDMILGKALKDVGIDLFWAYPNLQGDSLTTMNWNVSKMGREPWCYAPATFHHMNEAEFNAIWHFEQEWNHKNHGWTTLRFRDIFKGTIRHQLKPERTEWDNLSSETQHSEEILSKLTDEERNSLSPAERKAYLSFEDCQRACESKPSCIQFSHVQGRCSISSQLQLGHAVESQCLEYSNAAGKCMKTEESRQGEDEDENKSNFEKGSLIRSGWLMDRVSEYVNELDQSCNGLENNGWVT